MEKLVRSIQEDLARGIKNNGSASFVTCGGTSPIKIFQLLSKNNILEWSKVKACLVDDRCVPSDHKDSNERLLTEYLAVNKASNINVISLYNEPKEVLKIKRPFDVVLLGLGHDGHFASLFPKLVGNDKYLSVLADPEIVVLDEMGDPKHKRISMNLAMILQSKRIVLISNNKDKNKVIEDAYSNKDLPLYYLLKQQKVEVEIVDLNNSKPLYCQDS